MTIEEKIKKANYWSYQKDVKREVFEAAYQDWKTKRDRLQRRRDIITGVAFVLWILCTGIVTSLL